MNAIPGLILAGGLSRRMGGGDKCLIRVAGETLLDRAIDRITPQVGNLALNANGDPRRFAPRPLPVLADGVPGFLGPLAGILTGLKWAQGLGAHWCLTIPGDTPLFPLDLAERLQQAITDGVPAAIAASNGRPHPVFGLWPVTWITKLEESLAENRLGVWKFAQDMGAAEVSWDNAPHDPFLNVNTEVDVTELETILRRR